MVTVNWADVLTAAEYIVSVSSTAIGGNAGVYQQAGKVKSASFTSEFASGKRYYFRVSAKNAIQYSAASEPVYIDII